jgi:hypothetical protein
MAVSTVDTRSLPAFEQRDIAQNQYNTLPRKVLKVEFSSLENLAEYRKGWGDTYIRAIACRDWADRNRMVQAPGGGYVPRGPPGMDISGVYWNDLNVLWPVRETPNNVGVGDGRAAEA